jgi:hypothetical protein
MTAVEADGRLRRLAQLRWLHTVTNDGEMIIRPSRIVGGPSDDGDVVMRQLKRRALDDLNVLGSLCGDKIRLVWRVVLGDGRIRRQQAAKRRGDRQLLAFASPSLLE